jgi:hypothetical protein
MVGANIGKIDLYKTQNIQNPALLAKVLYG